MKKLGRNLLRLLGGTVASLFVSAALAQNYPAKPIRMFVGFSAGTGLDIAARLAAQKVSELLGQPVVVENRPGASGSIATELVVKSPSDGYTLLVMSPTETALPALRAKLAYDLERDLAPVSLIATTAFVLVVHPSVPARNVKEVIALARSQPGKLSFGATGVGSSTHLAGELFNFMAKATIVHVPYKGSTESLIGVVTGQVETSFAGLTPTLPLLKAGRLKAVAVTSAKRTSLLPSIPTIDESGLSGYDRSTWYGVSAPAGVPNEVIARLNSAIVRAVESAEMKESFIKQGLEPQPSTPEQFSALIHREIEQNASLIKAIGITRN